MGPDRVRRESCLMKVVEVGGIGEHHTSLADRLVGDYSHSVPHPHKWLPPRSYNALHV